MFMGKIGTKSAAFINHKPFHPGNLQNLEKVWIAEQKHEKQLKAQEELLERRKQEVQIEELKKALRRKDLESGAKKTEREEFLAATTESLERPKKARRLQKDSDGKNERLKNKSRYKEDVHEGKHTSVWGSYYDKSSGLWGFRCCKQTSKLAVCVEVQ